MKAFWIPLTLLSLLLFAALWTGGFVEQATAQWTAELEKTITLIPGEAWDESEERILNLKQDWNQRSTFFHIIMEHQDLNEVEQLLSGAIAACREEDSVELHILLRQLIAQIQFLREMQQASIKNIL